MAKAGWEAIARRCRNLLAEAEPLSGPDRGRQSKPRSWRRLWRGGRTRQAETLRTEEVAATK